MGNTRLVTIQVQGFEYGGWKSARVSRGIESVAGSFDLSVSDRWTDTNGSWPIAEEDECKVLVGGVPVITGYVDKRSLSYGASEHTLSVSGRDKTGDLVDCSSKLNQWEYNYVPVLTLIAKVCQPFGIPVTLAPGLAGFLPKPPAKISIDPGDAAVDVIEKACRMAGILAVSDGAGGLVLVRAGTSRCSTELVQGQNILAASADFEAAGKFRHYYVLGQHHGSDNQWGPGAAHIQGSAEDPNVRRASRLLLIRPEGDVTVAQATKRAQWEASVRSARGESVSVTVQGWTQADGALWPVNSIVRVRSPFLGVDGDMLITQATYSLDDGGTTTQLSLKPPEAFSPEPLVPLNNGNTGWKELNGGVKL